MNKKDKLKQEKIEISLWPILTPLKFVVILYLTIGGWMYKKMDRFMDWGVNKTR